MEHAKFSLKACLRLTGGGVLLNHVGPVLRMDHVWPLTRRGGRLVSGDAQEDAECARPTQL